MIKKCFPIALLTAACRTTAPEPGPSALLEALPPEQRTLLVCEAPDELAGGTRYALQVAEVGRRLEARLFAVFAAPPHGDELTIAATGDPRKLPSSLALEGGGRIELAAGAEPVARLAWDGRSEVSELWKAAGGIAMPCEVTGEAEARTPAALVPEQLEAESLRRLVEGQRPKAADVLGGAASLVAIGVEELTAGGTTSACDGFVHLRLHFAGAGSQQALVTLAATPAGEDCLYEPTMVQGPEARLPLEGAAPLGAAGDVERLTVPYLEARQRLQAAFPRFEPGPVAVLVGRARLLGAEPVWHFTGKACGLDEAALVGGARSDVDAPGRERCR